MELIDDWRQPVPPEQGHRGQARAEPVTPERIERQLVGFRPEILSVHCYEDLKYPWVHVVFDALIAPKVALDVGVALEAAAGPNRVYLNSLRPRSVYFVLAPAFEQRPELPVTRYGALLADVRECWNQPPAATKPAARPRRPNGEASSTARAKRQNGEASPAARAPSRAR